MFHFRFWDNYMKHVDEYSPLCGPRAEEALQIYRSPYDERTFHYRQNVKLHNKVKRFEEHEKMQLTKRLLMNSESKEDSEMLRKEIKQKNIGSRFLKSPESTLEEELQELRNERRKQLMINAAADVSGPEEGREDIKEGIKEEPKETDYMQEGADLDSNYSLGKVWKPSLKWPENYDDLPPIERPKSVKRPTYYGWTHSDEVDSWYLESHTKGSHDQYNRFYENLYGKKAICPHLWDKVFPETDRYVSHKKPSSKNLSRDVSCA